MNAARLTIAAAYVVLVAYPGYVAGTAPGEPITATRLALYAGAVIVSGALGIALQPVNWRYALPWLVAGAMFEVEVILRVASDTGFFRSPEFYLPLGLLAAAEDCAIWIGGRLRLSRRLPP